MKTTYVYNHSRHTDDLAIKTKCPKCRGFGGVAVHSDAPCLCNGYGWVWMTDSSWVRAPYARMQNSQLY
jgi:RecJ-like exonuclease